MQSIMATRTKSITSAKAKRPPGRPTKYNKALAYFICGELAAGKSLLKVCAASGMPERQTVYRWLDHYESFRDNYTRAKKDSADAHADDIHDISDKVLKGSYEPNAARVAIDAKKWIAARMQPKKYGDRLDVTSGGEKLPAPIYNGGARATVGDSPSQD